MSDWLFLHRAAIRPEWIDYNGHLNEAFYVLIAGDGTDAFYDHAGFDGAWRRARGRSLYTVESHVRYLREVPEAAQLDVASRLVAVDHRRLHLVHRLLRDGAEAATVELVALVVDTAAGRAALFEPDERARLEALVHPECPEWAGRLAGLPHSRPGPAESA